MKLLEKRKILPSPAKRILRWIIPVLLLGLLYLVYRFPSLLISEKGADYYCRHIFGKVSFVGNMLSNMVFYSITENIVIIGGAALLILIFVLIIKFLLRLLRGGRRRISGIIFMTVTSVLIIGVIMMTDFQLMHGINYLRTPVAVTLGINTGSKRSYDEYCEALKWAYEGMISSRQRLGTDYNGVAHMSTSYGESVIDANALLNSMSAKYDLGLTENYINA